MGIEERSLDKRNNKAFINFAQMTRKGSVADRDDH